MINNIYLMAKQQMYRVPKWQQLGSIKYKTEIIFFLKKYFCLNSDLNL